jgi:transposase
MRKDIPLREAAAGHRSGLPRRGHDVRADCSLAGIGTATVNRGLGRYRETGDVLPRPRGGGNFSPIRGKVVAQFERLVAQRSDATVKDLVVELRTRMGVVTSRPSLQRALHRLGFSHKKSPFPPANATRRKTSGADASSPRS